MATIFKAGNTAVITGGASGIGLSLAKKCYGYGMRVLVADYDDAALQKVGGEISTIKTDVSKLDDWAKLKSKVDQDFNGQVNLLALNAGVGGKSSWEDLSVFHKIIDTNLFGVLNGINTFLPSIKDKAASGAPSAIVITGSKQGITNPPGNPAYNLSKAAVKSAAEHLSYDLRDTSIGVHFLVPGWTHTTLTGAGTRDKPDGAWWPDQVVDYLEKQMNENQFWAICPDNDVTEALDRKRMQWTASDAIEGRPPLSRWREEWKDKHQQWISQQK